MQVALSTTCSKKSLLLAKGPHSFYTIPCITIDRDCRYSDASFCALRALACQPKIEFMDQAGADFTRSLTYLPSGTGI